MTMDNPYTPQAKAPIYESGRPRKQSLTGSAKGLLGDAAPPGTGTGGKQQQTMDNIQIELKAAQGAMEDNILKITQRGETLQHLQERTDDLSVHSQRLRSTAGKTRRRMWFQNAKWTICLSVFVLLILAGVIAGAIKGSAVVKEKVVEHISPVTAMPATSSSPGASSTGTVNLTPGPSPTVSSKPSANSVQAVA